MPNEQKQRKQISIYLYSFYHVNKIEMTIWLFERYRKKPKYP